MVQFDAESRPAETGEEVPGEIEDTWKPEDPRPGRPPASTPQPTRFYGRKELDPVRAMRDLGGIIDEVTKHLSGTGNEVTLTVEINARSGGYDTRTQRVVKEKRHPTRLRVPRVRSLTIPGIRPRFALLVRLPLIRE